MLHLFRVPSNVPLLHYALGDNHLSVKCSVFMSIALDIQFADLFTEVGVGPFAFDRHNSGFYSVVCNTLAIRIAQLTRRGAANYLFVPSEEIRDNIRNDLPNTEIIVDPSLDANEIRAMYWRTMTDEDGNITAIDGGISVLPDNSIVLAPNYNAYFLKTHWQE